MAQRRNSSGRGDERSDLVDMKALAAKARSEASGPVVVPNPAELSGVRPRRDSVIGARLTPPPRATGGELPNWFFTVLGCLSVLLVGFGGLFVLGRSGKLEALTGAPAEPAAPEAVPVAVAPPPVVEAPRQPAAPAPRAVPTAIEVAPIRHREPPPSDPEPAAGEPAAPKHAAAREHAPAPAAKVAHAPKADEAAPAPAEEPEEEGSDEAAEPKAALVKPARLVAAPKAAVAPAAPAEEAEDDQSAPGQDAVEAALDALSTRVRGCFVKYQIKGTARVRLVATPAGAAESVSVTGEFEDTPTGMCVEAVVAGAKLPSFKGPPLKLSQSYQLR